MVTSRGLAVLRAIVQDYVESREPVASKTIVDRHNFQVSAATIRNEMAQLEDEELIVAPHTSSGRVPTDKGYRVFVDRIGELSPLSQAQKNAIETFLTASSDLDTLLGNTVRLLAQLTNQVALLQYPSLGIARVRHIEIIQFDQRDALIVLITDSGRVEQRMLTLPEIADPEQMLRLGELLNQQTVGLKLSEAIEVLRKLIVDLNPADWGPAVAVISSLIEQINANKQDRLVVSGAANLVRTEEDFKGSIFPILSAVEEQVVLLRLFSELEYGRDGLSVRIGAENLNQQLLETSVVAGSYTLPTGSSGYLGVLGPTRMNYPSNFASVQAVAKYLTKILGEH